MDTRIVIDIAEAVQACFYFGGFMLLLAIAALLMKD